MIKFLIFNGSLLGLLFFFAVTPVLCQTSYTLKSDARAQISSQPELPFWMYSNQRGRTSPETNLMGLVTVEMQHQLGEEAVLEIGAGGLTHDGFKKTLALDEAYLQFSNQHFYITGGVKQKEEFYKGLSATNENILWSLNARPLPGVEIGTTAPIFLFSGLGFEGRWGEYVLEKDRHVPQARVHQKKFSLILNSFQDWQFKAGIQHFAQWGGISPERGRQPQKLKDYLRIFTARAGEEDSHPDDQDNSLGNHLGSWEISVEKRFPNFSLKFLYNSIFEDGSGSRLANFPDGRYALYFENQKEVALLESVLYELYYTKHQSHDTNRWGADNYMNHRTYRSGWSYFQNTIGAPFFIYNKNEDMIINNRFLVHHFGIAGNMTYHKIIPYQLLLSYRQNRGTYPSPHYSQIKYSNILSTYFTTRLFNGNFDHGLPRLTLDFHLAADFHNYQNSTFGAGISLIFSLAN